MTIIVVGLPGPQGSKAFRGMSKAGHAILTESSAKVKPWRQAVQYAAFDAGSRAWAPTVAGPVAVEMIFTLPRPKSAKRGALPSKRPDLSKLVRSTEDALTYSGVYEDDARIVDCISGKRYPGEGTDAMDVPGCVIRITAVHP